ncbi:putative Cysteine-rich secretory protein 2 [Hypsibius exemplaris]|uniref:Cysteine-rich secretory protein 2 n=1 Tax=Hypsibius exemplaris TaxID=2072580 RepID=A0A9X6NIF8_HYPEX|nr:putative Cysteine-rich secretory protein 2 [Hypsibius exemplaris]
MNPMTITIIICIIAIADLRLAEAASRIYVPEDYIVNKHNRVRGEVYPPARNMPAVRWSARAAKLAQNNAYSCVFGHEQNGCGENLAYFSGDSGSWPQALALWANEKSSFTYGGHNNFNDVGHYTQMVSERSTGVGCASASCDGWEYYVCSYCPAGNFNDWSRPYRT